MTIVVGFTPSPEGYEAVNFGIHQAQALQESLLVLNAGIGESSDEPGVATQEDLAKIRDRLAEELAGTKCDWEVKQFLRGNDAAEEILALTEASPEVRLIVIGSRNRSKVGKLFMGSTAQRIILGAEVPVISVKAGSLRRMFH